MGAYLSEPVTEKQSESGTNGTIQFGATSVQGWRISQEDAHNCILDFDSNCSLFAVYDGHGGAEVSEYTSKHLPEFIKSLDQWKQGNIAAALEDAFLLFDENLTKESAMAELKEIAGSKKEDENDDPTEDKALLVEEACLPLEEVLRKYGLRFSKLLPDAEEQAGRSLHGKKKSSGSSHSCKSDSKTNHRLDETFDIEPNDLAKSDAASNLSETPPENTADSNRTASDPDSGLRKRLSKNRRNTAAACNNTHDETCDTLTDNEVTLPDNSQSNEKDLGSPEIKRIRKEENKLSSDLTNGSLKADCPLQAGEVEPTLELPSGHLMHSLTTVSHRHELHNGCSPQMDSSAYNLPDETELAPPKISPPTSAAKSSDVDHLPTLPLDSVTDADVPDGRARSQSESAADNVDVVEFKSCAASWQSVSNLFDVPDVVLKRSPNSGSTSSKGKLPLPEVDISSDDSDDVDYNHEMDVEDESTSSSENEAGAENTFSDSNSEEKDEDASRDWSGVVEMPDSDDEQFQEASEEMFPMPNGDTPGVDSGTTACVVVLKNDVLYVANAGDSRCVISRGNDAVDLSIDHKPEDEIERRRIEAAGGQITSDGRVNGGLNLSRALGDHFYKKNEAFHLRDQMISALPDVRTLQLTPEDRFAVIACDGIWNSLSSQDVVDFVNEKLQAGLTLVSISEALCDKCLAPNTLGDGTGCDNMTVIIVSLSGRSSYKSNGTPAY